MAISVEKIKELGRSQGEALAQLIKVDPKKEIQWKEQYTETTLSGNTVLKTKTNKAKASDLADWFAERVTEAEKEQSTRHIDDLIYALHKPTFPFKGWLASYMDASDALNIDGMSKNADKAIITGAFKTDELDAFFAMSHSGCADAGRFSGMIKERDFYYVSQVLNRAWRAEQDASRLKNAESAKALSPSTATQFTRVAQWVDAAKSVYDATMSSKHGICTTFAWAAAGPLLTRMRKERTGSTTASDLKRVEVVSYTNHVFCIVNREGDKIAKGVKLPGSSTWGASVIQVDVWLGTLGDQYVFEGTGGSNSWCFSPLTSLFDSDAYSWA